MSKTVIQEYYAKSGISRDGTVFDSKTYIDGQWVRFYKDRPKKMGGYIMMLEGTPLQTLNVVRMTPSIARTVQALDVNDTTAFLLLIGRNDSVSTSVIPFANYQGEQEIEIIRDPSSHALPTGLNNVWQFSFVSYIASNVSTTYLIAFCAPNLLSLSNTQGGYLYYSNFSNYLEPGPLLPIFNSESVQVSVTGGFCIIGNTIFVYGNNGTIIWNDFTKSISTPFPGSNIINVGSENFIYGSTIRSGNQLAGLFWSTTSLVRGIYTPSTTPSATNPELVVSYVSTFSTCISPRCVVNYEPFFFWVGIDTFYQYNGTVSEVVNETNKLYFFNNLNRAAATKIYSFINTEYHEWWIGFPNMLGSDYDPTNPTAQECNWCLVYNILYQCWYDTPLNRATGFRAGDAANRPVMSDTIQQVFGQGTTQLLHGYPIWLHEYGTNSVDLNNNASPILSSITMQKSLMLQNPAAKNALTVSRVSLDLLQAGPMSFTISKLGYPRSTPHFTSYAFNANDQFITMSEKGTIFQLSFTSFAVGGDYLLGKTMIEYIVTDDGREQPINNDTYPNG